jgi:hypothetical protein
VRTAVSLWHGSPDTIILLGQHRTAIGRAMENFEPIDD